MNELQKKSTHVRQFSWNSQSNRNRLKTTACRVTFPLISCSTMFSGLRSLCMILFSCRYWIPDPGAENTVVKLNDKHLEDASEWRGFTEKKKIKHWTYQHHWVMRALHSLSNRSSFQVCSASGSHTNVILSQNGNLTWFDALPLLELEIGRIQDEKLKSNQVHLFFFLLANKKTQKSASQPTMQPS